EKQAGVERFDLIQTFHACKQEEGKPVDAYVLNMKGYVEQMEHLSYVLPQDLSVGLILISLTSDFAGFVINYNMHNMGKTIRELHAMLIGYEKGLPKKAETPQVMAIRSGKIQKANKKSLKAKGNGKANVNGKDKKVYIPKPKNPKPSAKEHPTKDDTCHHRKEEDNQGSLIRSRWRIHDQEFKDYLKACRIFQQLTPPYTPQHNGVSEKGNCTLLDMVRSMMNLTTLSLSFWDYALKSTTCILNISRRYVEFFEKSLITQEVSGRAIDLEEIQDEDTSPFKITSEIPMEVEEVEEHSLGDLYEPTSYKATMLDPESNKWLDTINEERQSMKDNQVWHLVDLPLNFRCTRPDVAFTQNITSRFQQNPGEPHWTATDRDDIKSQTGYVFILNGGVVDWKSSKQSTTVMSATEAEYIAASEAAMEAVWIRKFISGLDSIKKCIAERKLYEQKTMIRLKERKFQMQKCKAIVVQAFDANLVVTESSGRESTKQPKGFIDSSGYSESSETISGTHNVKNSLGNESSLRETKNSVSANENS
ncbi:retrotransposon protein, putative, ty1-copia subclass, partial [Tanacetum coccineum]